MGHFLNITTQSQTTSLVFSIYHVYYLAMTRFQFKSRESINKHKKQKECFLEAGTPWLKSEATNKLAQLLWPLKQESK